LVEDLGGMGLGPNIWPFLLMDDIGLSSKYSWA